jgi:ABC-type dipeptide/oligopeptide/nickel transport system permease component
LLYVLPGDPSIAMLGENVGSQETYRTLRRELGLDQPLWMQYGSGRPRPLRG